MARSKDMAAEAIIDCVRLVEAGDYPTLPNDESEATDYTMPTKEDLNRLRASGHRLR
jgi:hypothetical protein